MNKNRDTEYLIDIYNAGKEVITFVEKVRKEELEISVMRRNAILYSIQVMGEASKRLSTEFRQRNPHIPWKNISGMRDKIVHDYKKINLDLVWEVATINIPNLIIEIEKILGFNDFNK